MTRGGRRTAFTKEEREERARLGRQKWHEAKRKKNWALGICRCGAARKEGSTQCQACWARSREYNYNYRFELRIQAIEAYGGKCACCGETTPEFLQFDHKNDDGFVHRQRDKKARAGIALWLKQNNYPDTIQLLCGNCHGAKSFYGFCPHQNKKEEAS